MWVPIAILVVLVMVVGLFGLIGVFVPSWSPEIFVEKQIEATLHNILPHEIELHVPHIEVGTKWMAVGLSALMLTIGGSLGWFFYLAKKADPWAFVQNNGILKKLHTFVWNRWYINPFYYLVFVDGLIASSRMLFKSLEKMFFDKITPVVSGVTISLGNLLYGSFETDVLDKGLNVGIPKVFTALYNKVKKIQTGYLSYNIAYMAITFLVLFVLFMLMFGGMI
jgi:NADH-quinone oxidoreductase subunit L